MSKVLGFLARDLRHLRSGAIVAVVVAGIVAVPSFYAWFNIAGSWDPYGNTGNVSVAVANEDEGAGTALLPWRVNVGERVVGELRATDSIGYVVTSREDALEGVRSGAYYAAIVIPPEFSRDVLSALSADPVQARALFYQNEKANPIAAIVTDKASSAVRAQIERGFAEAVVGAGTGVLQELGRDLDDDALAGVAARLDDALVAATSGLEGAADDLRGFSALLDSTSALVGSGAQTADAALAPTGDVGNTLDEAASGLDDAASAVDGAQESIEGALGQAADGLDGVEDAINDALDAAGAQTAEVRKGLVSARTAVDAQIDTLERLADALEGQVELTREFQASFAEGSPEAEAAGGALDVTSGLKDRVDKVLSEMRELSDQLGKTIDDLDAGTADAKETRDTLASLVEDARSALGQARADFAAGAEDALEGLADQVRSAAGQAEKVAGGLATTLDAADVAATSAQRTLSGAQGSLDDAATRLDDAAARLSGLESRLRTALDSADMEQVRTVLSAGPESLASFVAQPVTVERTAVFPVENNGSAMTPFYTTLAIWIGGVVLAALVVATPSARALAETGCSPVQALLARWALFAGVGLVQAALIAGGDLLYLGVQCEHPWLFLLACCASSLVYVSLIYALSACFGDVGKAVAVVLMVVQVAGSGGTFPSQMLPPVFQEIYRWLPFVHSEAALRAAMFGTYGGDYWRELVVLLAYLVPALVLALMLRRPTARLGAWFERRLEATRLM